MAQTADIIIVGGGIMGVSIAYSLARQKGGRIILLERRALSSGTTGHSGAIIRQHYSNDVTIQMAQESLHVFEQFANIVGGECGFVSTGMLVLSDQQGASTLQANVERQRRLGVNTRIIDPSDINEIAPGYSGQDVALACYEADAGVADPVATAYCYGNRAREQGVTIYEGVEVTQLLAHNEQMRGVITTSETFLAPKVIVAANVWSVPLLQQLGISLPVKATRHPMATFRRLPEKDGRASIHAICLDETQHIYIRPATEGVTWIGSLNNVATESKPDSYMQVVTEDEVHTFHALGGRCFPALKQAVVRGGWAGLYDETPDYHPILGQLAPYEGLYCAVGFSGHGFKLSPCVGKWMAQLVLMGQGPAEMQHFAYERFAQGKVIQSGYGAGVIG